MDHGVGAGGNTCPPDETDENGLSCLSLKKDCRKKKVGREEGDTKEGRRGRVLASGKGEYAWTKSQKKAVGLSVGETHQSFCRTENNN